VTTTPQGECSELWKPGSRRRPGWRRVLGKSEKGCWEFGMGREWGGDGKGEVSSKSNLGPRRTGSYHVKEGFQVSKREVGLEKEGISQGSKNKGFAIIIVLLIVYMYIIIV
jgi:hypothetical protein